MVDIVTSLGPWSWIIVGAILLTLELTVPGAFMMWLGLAALLVGVITFGIDWSWQTQGVAFAVFAIASVPLWRHFASRVESEATSPYLNRRTQEMVGRVFTLDTPIVNGVGTVKVGDTVWQVNGPETPAGSRVKVISADGADLRVEPAA